MIQNQAWKRVSKQEGALTSISQTFFLCSLLSVFMSASGHAIADDAYCLRSIKDSLQDSLGSLWSWQFKNTTTGFICDFVGVQCWNLAENRVLSIELSNMGLKGKFPRGLENCSSLTALDLSSNHFSGPIPSDLSALLPYAVSIQLSNNKFSGEIPSSFGAFTYLNYLKLDNNMFTGQIPPEIGNLPRISYISFANNKLTGQVPEFRNAFAATADCYVHNMGLCGGPLEPCSLDDDGFHQSFKDGLIPGFAFSSTCFLVVAYISCCGPWTLFKNATGLGNYICSIIGRKPRMEEDDQIQQLLALQFQEKGSKKISVLMERLTSTMKFDELNDATDCFSIDNAIGVGKMGIMYKGLLPNGWHLAVKRVLDSQLFGRQVFLEIRILGKLRHKNIVPLLGFCVERNERILVYQYMSNGRLSKWLHPLESEATRLTGKDRIRIALGVARALSWLHHTCNLHIVHLNISSECILLDKNFEPKISNFGEAKFMNPNNHDDLGMAFYVKDGKKDVYDFGSLLFELVKGKTFKELSYSTTSTNLYGNPSNFYDAVDNSLIGKGFENEVFTLLKVACECVQPFPDQRPTMLQVYINMSSIWGGAIWTR